jgi:UDP-N-acetylglucosamine 2-epimerase (non-hydrolysing)
MSNIPRKIRNVFVVFGARPSVIKLAPVIHALRLRGATVSVCHTGQHGEMLACCLQSVGVEITHRIDDAAGPDGGLARRLGSMVAGVGQILESEPQDAVIVVGDTVSGLAGAMAGAFADVPVAHVEAGLRTHAREPWPEEMTRRAIDALATWHFAPTPLAEDNLQREGIDPQKIHVVGNTVVDALRLIGVIRHRHAWPQILVTVHRRENWGQMRRIADQVRDLAARHPVVAFRWPVHPNPCVRGPVVAACDGLRNVTLLPPLPYDEFLHELGAAWLAISDSGGVQEEAATMGVPAMVLRGVTERPEAIDAGVTVLADAADFAALASALITDHARLARMGQPSGCFGDGRAGERIAAVLLHGRTPLGEPDFDAPPAPAPLPRARDHSRQYGTP